MMHPALEEAFNVYRARQQEHVTTAVIQRTLRETKNTMENNMEELICRGNDLESMEEQAQLLEESSREFLPQQRCRCFWFPWHWFGKHRTTKE